MVFYPNFVCEGTAVSNCSIHDLIAHIEYIKNLIGIDHIGFGSDFDGIPSVLTGLEDVSKYPFSKKKKKDIKKIKIFLPMQQLSEVCNHI